MELNFLETKVSYDRVGEDGLNTKVNEVYLVQGCTFSEIEMRIIEELQPFVTGECNINKIERTKYNELVDSASDIADKWFKCKIAMITIDEVSAKEKKNKVLILVKAEDVDNAIKELHKYLESSVCDYELVSVTDSPIVDVFKID